MSRSPEEIARYHEQNRKSWNAVTAAHNSHKVDQARFFRDGGSTLFPEEIELLGPLRGRRVVHLQCNCGQDTLSLASLGASVVGVDIADRAIETAKSLRDVSGIEAEFECSDVLLWLEQALADQRQFDRVFVSYGSIYWLADLRAWAAGIAGVLAPGGSLVLMEFHPMYWCLNEEGKLKESYFQSHAIHSSEGVPDYVARSGEGLTPSGYTDGVIDFENPEPSVEFQWTIGEIVTAIARAGLVLECLHEYPYSNGCRFWDSQTQQPGNRFGAPKGIPEYPHMFGLVARR